MTKYHQIDTPLRINLSAFKFNRNYFKLYCSNNLECYVTLLYLGTITTFKFPATYLKLTSIAKRLN